MDTASVSANRVTASAAGARALIVSSDRSGADSGGSEAGKAPTVPIPVSAWPMVAFSTIDAPLPTSMATIIYGTRGKSLLVAIPVNRVTAPTAVTKPLISPKCAKKA